ncbi:MAG: hypothetical protein ACLP8S_18050, partial [Solirubrobacteraceae bacterium]
MPYCIRPPAQVGPGYIFASGDREAWFRAVKCYPSRAALIEETVRLAGGGDGAPLTGAYLRPVQQHRPAEGASITTPTPTPTPRLTPTPTPAAGPSRPSANQPTPSDGLLTRLTALEQRLAISDQRSQAILQRLESFAAESAVDRAAVRELRDSVHYVAR